MERWIEFVYPMEGEPELIASPAMISLFKRLADNLVYKEVVRVMTTFLDKLEAMDTPESRAILLAIKSGAFDD